VEAFAAGHAVVTVQAGTGRASVAVEVREGARPVQRDLEWDLEHAGDCTEPESVGSATDLKAVVDGGRQTWIDGMSAAGRFQSDSDSASSISDRTSNPPTQALGTEQPSSRVNASSPDTLKPLARPAVLREMGSLNNRAIKTASHKIPLGKVFPVIDPDGGDTTSPDAAKFNNAVGSPRFTAQDVSPMGSSKTRRQLGSYNYTFTAPVLGLGGRGTGVGLALSYNSRLWNKDGSTMTFNYNKGWPAAGWTLGYGRIIKNYDNTATGDGTGVGQFNRPGNGCLSNLTEHALTWNRFTTRLPERGTGTRSTARSII